MLRATRALEVNEKKRFETTTTITKKGGKTCKYLGIYFW